MLSLGCAKESCTILLLFSLTAEADDGTCFYQGDECDDGDDNTSNDTVSDSCICEGVEGCMLQRRGVNGEGGGDVNGCTDSAACN